MLSSFSFFNTKIKVKLSVKLLGVQIDSELNFNLHIANICRSAANQLNALIRLKHFLGFEEKKVLKLNLNLKLNSQMVLQGQYLTMNRLLENAIELRQTRHQCQQVLLQVVLI